MVAVPEGETGIVTLNEGEPAPSAQAPSNEDEQEEDEKATLNTSRFQPEVRRSKRRIGKRKSVIIDTTMEFKASEQDNIELSAEEEKAAISAKVKKVLQKKVKDHNAGSSKYKVSTLPASKASTSAPHTPWPCASASARNCVSNVAASISLRSNNAHALVSGSVALIPRMKFSGRLCSAS